MFETLENRQFLSTTPTTDAPTTDTASAPAVDAQPTTDIRQAGDNQQEYLAYKMKRCFITSYST
jgi:hypothetical protein